MRGDFEEDRERLRALIDNPDTAPSVVLAAIQLKWAYAFGRPTLAVNHHIEVTTPPYLHLIPQDRLQLMAQWMAEAKRLHERGTRPALPPVLDAEVVSDKDRDPDGGPKPGEERAQCDK
jgi:hypothetical protein